MPRQLQLQPSSAAPLNIISDPPQYPISSYPLEKYSYSVTNASETSFNSSQIQWTHYTHRDNLYFVIDTSLSSGPINGVFMKVVWSTQVLEYLDFSTLFHQTIPASNPNLPPQPALLSIAKAPCLAVRYPSQNGQTIRRFQLRFTSDAVFHTVRRTLEAINFPIQEALTSQSRGGQTQVIGQVQPIAPFHYSSQLQGNASSVCTQGANMPPHAAQISQSHLMPPPITHHSYPMRPPTLTASPYQPSPLPPPRQLPSFLRLSESTSAGLETGAVSNQIVPIEDLPPLRKPTSTSKPRKAPRAKNIPKPKGQTPLVSGVITNASLTPKASGIAIALDGVSPTELPEQFRISSPSSFTAKRPHSSDSGFAAGNNYFQKPCQTNVATSEFELRSSPPLLSGQNHSAPAISEKGYKRTRFEVAASPEPAPVSSAATPDTVIDGILEGRYNVVDPGYHQNRPSSNNSNLPSETISAGDDTEARTQRITQERLRALENLIVDKIHDEDFCKLLCDIGKVWQRMGFEDVFQDGKLFDIGDGR